MSTTKDSKQEIEFEPNLNIEKEVKLLYDGRQFLIKIPREIEHFFKLEKNKGIKLRLIVDPNENDKGSFEVLR